LCSSYLQSHGYRLDSTVYDLSRALQENDSAEIRQAREIATQLKELESAVLQLLKQCVAAAVRTIIITNAEQGWVQLSCSKFMPSLMPYLETVSVVSARSSFESIFPDSPLRWKYNAMHSCLIGGGFFGTDGRSAVDKHVLSLGDSHVEREAVRAICRGMPSTRTKSVKFSEKPTAEQLRRQIELINSTFGYITSHSGDLDLQLTVTQNPVTEKNGQQQQQQQQQQKCDSPAVSTSSSSSSSSPTPVEQDSEVKDTSMEIASPTLEAKMHADQEARQFVQPATAVAVA
jgi:hypothetical protein